MPSLSSRRTCGCRNGSPKRRAISEPKGLDYEFRDELSPRRASSTIWATRSALIRPLSAGAPAISAAPATGP